MTQQYATKNEVQDMIDRAVKEDVQNMIDHAVKVDVQAMIDHAVQVDVRNMIQAAVADLTVVISDFVGHIDERFNRLEKRMDESDKDNTVRDDHLGRLDRWTHKIANETGVQLS